jgi:hypothetical protein
MLAAQAQQVLRGAGVPELSNLLREHRADPLHAAQAVLLDELTELLPERIDDASRPLVGLYLELGRAAESEQCGDLLEAPGNLSGV